LEEGLGHHTLDAIRPHHEVRVLDLIGGASWGKEEEEGEEEEKEKEEEEDGEK